MTGLFTPEKQAIFSDCDKYRFRLERDLGRSGKTYAFFGVNPSVADDEIDDSTVRKWTGFVSRWGGGRFIVGNVSPYRATDVNELKTVADPVPEMNAHHLQTIARDADVLVPCWGALNKVPERIHHYFDATAKMLLAAGKPVMCFGYTKDDDPLHVLMLGYGTQLVNFENKSKHFYGKGVSPISSKKDCKNDN